MENVLNAATETSFLQVYMTFSDFGSACTLYKKAWTRRAKKEIVVIRYESNTMWMTECVNVIELHKRVHMRFAWLLHIPETPIWVPHWLPLQAHAFAFLLLVFAAHFLAV